MITYEAAKKVALKINKQFNVALDYGTAFVFSIKGSTDKSSPNIAVMKKSGEPVPFTQFLLNRNTNASPVSIPF